jgi:hypothetical protein
VEVGASLEGHSGGDVDSIPAPLSIASATCITHLAHAG